MTSDQNDLISEAFIEVLQRQAFLFADPEKLAALHAPGSGWVRAAIAFAGPFSGKVEIALTPEVQREAAGNVLGVDADDELAIHGGDDALKELLNVVCGHLLTSLGGENAVFDLGIPEILPRHSDEADILSHPEALGFSIDGQPVVLRLQMATPA